jgi:hypothetical protein
MKEPDWISEWGLAEQIARSYYLQTGRLLKTEVFLAEIQRKFNHNHDPHNGRFTFGPGGSSPPGSGGTRIGNRPLSGHGRSASSHAANASASSRPIVIAASRRAPSAHVAPAVSRSSVAHESLIVPSRNLRSHAASIPRGRNELHRMPNLDVVLFGPGVSLMPVPIPTFQTFDSAVRQASRMHDLDAVITGPQFDRTLIGSDTMHGQAVIGGRVYGKSAPGLYYFATVSGADGIKHLDFGKGDPSPTRVEVGIGGGVPMLLGGNDVPGYNIAWNAHRSQPGKGKNIVAYNSRLNTSAIFVQRDGQKGTNLRQIVDYIKSSGFDYALMFDGSGSTSLSYRGEQVISPDFERQPIIPLGIGFRSP